MKKWHIVVDIDKCVGCFNCLMACKDEHVGNDWFPYTDEQQRHGQNWINVEKKERGAYPHADVAYIPKTCNHCANPPCMKAAPNAVRKRADGIVQLDPAMAKDNKALVSACPYGYITWNEEIGAAQKCTFCAHLIDDGWTEPRCVQACPLKARRAVLCEDHNFEKLVSDKGLEPIVPVSSKPRAYYKNLHRIEKCFIAGSAAYKDGGRDTCAKNVEVSLIKDKKTIKTAMTDAFGDFRIDALPKNSGEYTVTINFSGGKAVSVDVNLAEDCVDIGVVYPK